MRLELDMSVVVVALNDRFLDGPVPRKQCSDYSRHLPLERARLVRYLAMLNGFRTVYLVAAIGRPGSRIREADTGANR